MEIQFRGDTERLKDSIIVIGGGVGWTGSLGLDLVINTFPHESLGPILSPFHMPMAGCGVYQGEENSQATTTVEVYHLTNQPKKINIIQQRGPILPNQNELFSQALVRWAQKHKVSQIVYLLSVDATRRIDNQIGGSQNRIWTSKDHPSAESLRSMFQELETETMPYYLRPTAFPSLLMKACETQENGVPLLVFLRFCAEGNNLNDSGEMASMLISQFLDASEIKNLQAPPSWKHIQGGPLMRDAFIY